ncbi:MAG TPA: PHP domain-containing protein [Dehalococcoidia bacterium]|nr:PHP domain-containing protein [Dehalococcoidia bacterium]
MLIDLHTHTDPLSHDSLLTPDHLIDLAKAAGLNGVCLTEHDFFWEPDKARELRRKHSFLVIPGIEVNTEDGHILVFGLEKYVYGMHRIRELEALVDAEGGVMLAAHPYRRQLPFELRHEGDWADALDRAAANAAYRFVAGMESHNGRGTPRENAFAMALAERLRLPQVAGSDAHASADVGTCATEFDREITGLDDLIEELQAGRFRPAIPTPPHPEESKHHPEVSNDAHQNASED